MIIHMQSRKNANFLSNVRSAALKLEPSSANLPSHQPFNALAIKSPALSKKCRNIFFFRNVTAASMHRRNLNWTRCCTFGRFTQPSKVLHSDGKFIQPNMWTVDPQSPLHRPLFRFFPFSIFFHFQFPRYINHSLPSCPPCFPREGLW